MDIALLAIGLVVGALIGWLIGRSRAAKSELAAPDLTADVARSQATIEQLELRLEEANRAQAQLVEQQKAEREQREAKAREDASVLEKLAPVGDVVNKMQAKLDELTTEQAKRTTEIQTQLKHSLDVTNKLSESTQSLSKVMSDSSQRGTWGELQLERVAELSGLHKGVNYVLQKAVEGEDNRGKPDMTVFLPGDAKIAVDAKAPFNAYNEAQSGDVSTEQRKLLLGKHAKDLRGHIQVLSQRDYASNLQGRFDYVICFVPADSMLAAALETDTELLEYAISKNVVLASPTSLVAVLKPIALLWRQVENAERAGEIVEMGKELYGRLSTMASHAAKLGKSIQASASSYNDFVSSLEKRVLVTARRFDKLAAADLPELTTVDGTVNLFSTAELRGMNAELDAGQLPVGEPEDAVEVDSEEV